MSSMVVQGPVEPDSEKPRFSARCLLTPDFQEYLVPAHEGQSPWRVVAGQFWLANGFQVFRLHPSGEFIRFRLRGGLAIEPGVGYGSEALGWNFAEADQGIHRFGQRRHAVLARHDEVNPPTLGAGHGEKLERRCRDFEPLMGTDCH